MVSGGMTCVKYMLFVFNLLFAISGIAILTVGALIQAAYSQYTPFVNGNFFTGPVILIVVGVIIFVVAFFGCCGAVTENHRMIIVFAVFLVLIFLLEVSGGIAGYILRDDVKSMLDERLNATLGEYGEKPEVTHSWDSLQHDFHCCGIHSSLDWKVVYPNGTLPSTCCPESIVGGEACLSAEAYQDGCYNKFTQELEHNAMILGGVGIGIAVIQLVGVIFACCLAKSIRREYETV